MAKIRIGFVANSSSSSFLIVGKAVECSYVEADKLQQKMFKCGYPHKDKYQDQYLIGIDIDPGIEDRCEVDAESFLFSLQEAIKKCKEVGIDKPTLFGECSYDG